MPNNPLNLEVGKYYRTYGGWKALIIYRKITSNTNFPFVVIHCPGDGINEYGPIFHDPEGRAIEAFAISAPPRYSSHHPADIAAAWPQVKMKKDEVVGRISN